MGKSKRSQNYIDIADLLTEVEARESSDQESEKIIANHSPYKNKVLKNSLVRGLRKIKKEKEVIDNDDDDLKAKSDSKCATLMTEIQNSKFPIVLVKPVSNENLEDPNEELKTEDDHEVNVEDAEDEENMNKFPFQSFEEEEEKDEDEHFQKFSHNLDDKFDKFSFMIDSKDEIFSFNNQTSEPLDSLPEPLNNKVCLNERKIHRKRGRKRKIELSLPKKSENLKKLKNFNLDEKFEETLGDEERLKNVGIESLRNVESSFHHHQTSNECDNDTQSLSHLEEKKQKYLECGFESDEREIQDNIPNKNQRETSGISEYKMSPVEKMTNARNRSITEVIKTNYKCNFCKYESKIRAHAREHSLTHANFRLFKCSLCDFKTNRKDKILQHLSKIHKLESSCVSECSYVITQDIDVAKEISFCQTVSEETVKAFKCSVCGYLTEEKLDAERHLEIHSEIDFGLVNAADCDQESTERRRRRKTSANGMFDRFYKTIKKFKVTTETGSRSVRTTSIFKCSICNYQTIKIDRAKRHSLTHSAAKLFKCSECEFDTNRSEKMQSHLHRIHGIESGATARRSRSKNYLHNLVPHSESASFGFPAKIYKCCFCDYQTDLNYEAAQHFADHFKSPMSLVESSEFGRVADLNNTFQAQKNRRVTKYSEVIERCYGTITEIEIQDSSSHSVTEQRILYKCTVCNYETKNKSRSKRHSLNHLDTKLFKCKVCEYACNRKDKMKIHEARHGEDGKEIRRGRRKISKESASRNPNPVNEFGNSVDDIFNLNDSQYDDSECNLLSDSLLDLDILNGDTSFQSDYFESFEDGATNFTPNSYPEFSGLDLEEKEFVERENYPQDAEPPNQDCSVDKKPVYSFAELLKCAEYDYQSYKDSDVAFTSSEIERTFNDTRYSCYFDDKLVRNHSKSEFSEDNILECSQCDFETTSANVLENHKKSCDMNYRSPGLKSPKESPKRKIFNCPECPCQFKYKKVWIKHIQTHMNVNSKTSSNRFKCSECDYENDSEENLKKHFTTHEKPKMFKCSNCNYETKYKFAILKHNPACIKNTRRVQEFRRLFPEPSCSFEDGYTFTDSDDDINNNMQADSDSVMPPSSTVKVLKCAECTFQTYSRNRLKKHLQIHRNELPSFGNSDLVESPDCNCDTCVKDLTNELALVHNNAKELFKCSECDYVTHIQEYLVMHSHVHSDANLIGCPQ